MDDKPRNLRTLLADAKDTSELMVDLAYAAVYFGDPDMADEVRDLESVLTQLVADMRSLAVLGVRHPREAPGMGRVLQVISAIERIGNDAVNIARTVTNNLGIPTHLVEELRDAEEVSHRVVVVEGSTMAHSALIDLELPVLTGMRILAVRGGDGWTTAVSGETILVPDDVLFLEGPPAGIPTVRELAGAPPRQPIPETEPIEELDLVGLALPQTAECDGISAVSVPVSNERYGVGGRADANSCAVGRTSLVRGDDHRPLAVVDFFELNNSTGLDTVAVPITLKRESIVSDPLQRIARSIPGHLTGDRAALKRFLWS